MLDLIMKNIEWVFSGIGVAVLGAVGRWLWSKKRKNELAKVTDSTLMQRIMSHHINININIGNIGIGYFGGRDKIITTAHSAQQIYNGSGDNVGHDKLVHQSSINGDDITGDKIINTYLLGSVDYQQLEAEIKDGEELLAHIPTERTDLRLKQATKLAELRKQLADFKVEVFSLHELFTRIPINTERLWRAKEHFDKGEFREADAVLKAEEIKRDVERLKIEQTAAKDKLAAIEQGLADRANEFLLNAQLSLLTPVEEGEDRFQRTEGYFTQALAAARTAEVLHAYAVFLYEYNAFSRSEPLYQEALQQLRRNAETEPKAFLPDMATTLNNLAKLHAATQDYGTALKEYEEALKIRRSLAEDEPKAFLQDVAQTLNNLANLHSATQDYGQSLKEYEEALKIRRSLAETEPEAFLQDVADTLNNLATLHAQMQNYGQSLKEYEEALKIRRNLAEAKPKAFNQALAETLLNLSIFYLQAMPDRAKSVAYAQEARSILIPLCKQLPHLQGYLDKAEQLLAANKAKP